MTILEIEDHPIDIKELTEEHEYEAAMLVQRIGTALRHLGDPDYFTEIVLDSFPGLGGILDFLELKGVEFIGDLYEETTSQNERIVNRYFATERPGVLVKHHLVGPPTAHAIWEYDTTVSLEFRDQKSLAVRLKEIGNEKLINEI